MNDIDAQKIILNELLRQQKGLELIPSENYVSRDVLEALGSVFSNKYSEGYPHKRYYGGQEFTDEIELLAIERAKKLFWAQYVNVQPHSGAPANLALYFALCEPGDTILGMELSHGGHLTHGHPATMMPKMFNFKRYGVEDFTTGEINYNELEKIAKEIHPKVMLAGYSSYTREIDYERFVAIAQSVGAYAVFDAAHIAGLIAGGAVRNPFDAGFDVMTMTTHKTLRGPRGGMIVVREDESIAKRIDKAIFPGLQGGPHMNTIAAKAVALHEALQPSFSVYVNQILKNCKAMEKAFRNRGISMVFGGSSNHMLLINSIASWSLSGREVEERLDSIGITLNKNVIPNDPRGPLDPSGVRLGTPALTTRGFIEDDCIRLAECVCDFLDKTLSRENALSIIEDLTLQYPLWY